MENIENELISIILPVYNVSIYLDKCLQSVTSQYYTNLEILIINDGSTDSSGDICSSWAKKDNRIVYLKKQNEGLGPTRNLGIKLAKGKYMAFVDPDDWIASDYIEKLYEAIRKEDADIAECNFYKVFEYTDRMAYYNATGAIGYEYTKEEKILYANVSQCNKLSRREVWLNNNILMPNYPGEDLAVNSLLLILANKVVNVPEALYYYRIGRINSISNSIDNYAQFINSVQYLVNSFKDREIFKKNEELLYRHILRWVSRYLTLALGRIDENEYDNLRSKWLEFLDDIFPKRNKKKYITFGGFNLGRIAIKMQMLEDPYYRFQFSNINSVMSDEVFPIIDIEHNNPYRQVMIKRDIRKSFRQVLCECDCSYILIDFIEERYDTLIVNNKYITFSDAIKDIKPFPIKGDILNSQELSKETIWEQNCTEFVKILKEKFIEKNIILVENYLTECYGSKDKRASFLNIEEIKKINIMLKYKYDFFKAQLPDAIIIDASKYDNYYTDINYEYGCFPWHLNDIVNIRIASEIEKFIDEFVI